MPIHWYFPGITGDSANAAHRGWIDVLEVDFSTRRRITSATATRHDRESANAEITDLMLRKFTDSATPQLFLESCCGGGHRMLLEMTKTGAGRGSEAFLRYELRNAIVRGYKVVHKDLSRSKFALNRPVEEITLSFTALALVYTTYGNDGEVLAPVHVGFDTATNEEF
jgi:type VI secretion system secreted protein Hcp